MCRQLQQTLFSVSKVYVTALDTIGADLITVLLIGIAYIMHLIISCISLKVIKNKPSNFITCFSQNSNVKSHSGSQLTRDSFVLKVSESLTPNSLISSCGFPDSIDFFSLLIHFILKDPGSNILIWYYILY